MMLLSMKGFVISCVWCANMFEMSLSFTLCCGCVSVVDGRQRGVGVGGGVRLGPQ